MSHVAQIKQLVQEAVQEILDFLGLDRKLCEANARIDRLEERVGVLEEKALPSVARRPSVKAQASTATAKGTSEK